MKLWSPKDLARELDQRRTGVVNNWVARGQLPEPFARTAGGTPLWTDDQAREILQERRDHLDRLIASAETRDNLDAVLAGMLARGVKV